MLNEGGSAKAVLDRLGVPGFAPGGRPVLTWRRSFGIAGQGLVSANPSSGVPARVRRAAAGAGLIRY